MKLFGNQAMAHFVAAATLSSSFKAFGSARTIGSAKVLRQAPSRKGYDPTAPVSHHDSSDLQQLHQFHYDPTGSNLINDVLTVVLMEDGQQQGILQNNTANNTNTNGDDENTILDIGVLTSATAPAQTPTLSTTTTIESSSNSCMMGSDGETLLPASEYLQNQIDHQLGGYGNIVFDAASNTVVCNQNYNVDEGGETRGCAKMHFKGCDHVKCNGNESCLGAIIEDADFIECEGYRSCYDSSINGNQIDCGGESACQGAIIGDKQLVESLDCHSGESACAYAKTYSVGDVFCTGPLACYGAELMGVEKKVDCQGVPHLDGYYMQTCGGEDAIIEAADDTNIDVLCDGDFSCIGYGHNAYDEEEHAVYFDIDVGKNGTLFCSGSTAGNVDGGTYVCQYIDIIQGCANYECTEPSFLALVELDDDDLQQQQQLRRTCNHVFSVHHHQMCYEGPNDYNGYDDDDDDYDDDDDDDDDR